MSMSTEDVCGALTVAGADEDLVGRIFAARLEPEHLDDPMRKFAIGVPLGEERAMLVVYRFGKPPSETDDEYFHWIPQWLEVAGPFPLADAEAKAKELTSA
jgi:hypothetical protein